MAILTQPLSCDLTALSARPTLAPLARVAVKAAVLLMAWDEAYRSRQALKHLSPQQLDDIGVTRAEALREARRRGLRGDT